MLSICMIRLIDFENIYHVTCKNKVYLIVKRKVIIKLTQSKSTDQTKFIKKLEKKETKFKLYH